MILLPANRVEVAYLYSSDHQEGMTVRSLVREIGGSGRPYLVLREIRASLEVIPETPYSEGEYGEWWEVQPFPWRLGHRLVYHNGQVGFQTPEWLRDYRLRGLIYAINNPKPRAFDQFAVLDHYRALLDDHPLARAALLRLQEDAPSVVGPLPGMARKGSRSNILQELEAMGIAQTPYLMDVVNVFDQASTSGSDGSQHAEREAGSPSSTCLPEGLP